MYDAITTKESIVKKAKAQFSRGAVLSDCPFPFRSEAEKTWKAEWERLDAERRSNAKQAAA